MRSFKAAEFVRRLPGGQRVTIKGDVTVTTNDSAAGWYARKPFTLATLVICMSFTLTGCGTTDSLFGGDPNGLSLPSVAGGTTPSGEKAVTSKVAIAPVIGAPDKIGKQIQSQLTAALAQRNIGVSPSTTSGSAYTLRGYVVSAREATGTKISYIWDVTNASGKRVNRITGEELAPASANRDPWQTVSPQITQAIASKTAGSLAAWLPTQAPKPAAVAQKPTTPSATTGTPTAKAPATTNAPVQNAALNQGGANTTTGAVAALVPTVVGAPGDGGVSLTSAIQRELQRNGIGLAKSPGAQNYTIEGKVNVGAGKNGKQPIQIDWHVKDPKGKKLGTVSQKNEIPQGSLDGAWGQTANAAAAAAAQGILKLLPKSQAQATTSAGTF